MIMNQPILALVLGWVTYSLYIFRQNKKLRKDLEQREIINDINEAQKANDNLNLVDLVRLANEDKLRRNEARSDNQKK